MNDPVIVDGSDPVESNAPLCDARTAQYARTDTVKTYYDPKRYYGLWTASFDSACTGGGFGSSIIDNGHILTNHRCPNGTAVTKITSPASP